MYQLGKLTHSGNFIPDTIIEIALISVTYSIFAIANFRHSGAAGMCVQKCPFTAISSSGKGNNI